MNSLKFPRSNLFNVDQRLNAHYTKPANLSSTYKQKSGRYQIPDPRVFSLKPSARGILESRKTRYCRWPASRSRIALAIDVGQSPSRIEKPVVPVARECRRRGVIISRGSNRKTEAASSGILPSAPIQRRARVARGTDTARDRLGIGNSD